MKLENSFIALVITSVMIVTTVRSQAQDIVSVKTIEDKGTFSIVCSASQVVFPAEYSDVTNIFSLDIRINTTAEGNVKVAEYIPTLNPEGFKHIPANRNWIVINSGANVTSNRNTLKIEVLVRDAMCTDAGIYTCNVNFYSATAGMTTLTGSHNVSAKAKTVEPVLTLEPLNDGPTTGSNYSTYKLNENVTMTCRVEGPENLVIKWRREMRPSASNVPSFEDYPYLNEISTDPTTRPDTATTSCSTFTYISRLRFMVSDDDTNRVYQCAVQLDNVDVIKSGATINVITEVKTAAPLAAAGSKPDIGLIVGIVVGCIAAIVITIIIVAVILHRRKSKNKYKDNTDRPDGDTNQNAYPPVTSHAPKPVNYDRGSKALDPNEKQDTHLNGNDIYQNIDEKPKAHNQHYDKNFNHELNAVLGHRNHGLQDDLHYASANVSRSEDESSDPVVSFKPKPKPKPKSQRPRNPNLKDEGRDLHYAELDLPPDRNERLQNAGRKTPDIPVEYAEISV